MSDITKSLLSTYYGFGKEIDAARTLSVHDSGNVLSDDTNISLVDESLENEDNTSTKEDSKEEDTIEHYENGFSTLDERSTIEDEEVFDEDFLNEYVDVLESLREQKDSENFKIEAHFQEVNSENLNSNENINTENSINASSSSEKVNEDQKQDENLSTCAEPLPKKNPSCNGIFFDISGLGISVFPENIFIQFPNLKMIYLEGNRLKELPDALFTTLKFLQWLDLRNNQLNYLPSSVKGHPNLETILIQRNKFERLPLELGTLLKLRSLQTAHNPLIYPPTEILSLGSTEILRYLRDEWNRMHPEELIESSKDSEEIALKPSTILSYQPITKNKKTLKLKKKGSTPGIKTLEKKSESVRKKTWNYKPSNRCDLGELDESLENRLLWIEKAKELLEERNSALQKLLDASTLKNWRYDRSSFNKSMAKAANRTEEDIPFAVDPNSIAVSMKQNQKKKPVIKGTANRNRVFKEPITDINKNIDDLFKSLDELKATKTTESLSPKTEKKMLESEIQKITELHNSIKHLQKHNDMITAPYAGRKISQKSYDFPPSIII